MVSSAPERFARTPSASSCTIGLSVDVDEPHRRPDVDLLPDRALDVLVDDEAVDVAPARCGALGGDPADERRVGGVQPLVERDVRAVEGERRRREGECREAERDDRDDPQGS